MKHLASKIFLIFGLWCLVLSSMFFLERYQPSAKQNTVSLADTNTFSVNPNAKPARMIIKSINVDLPIVPSQMKNWNWEMTDRGVSYLVSSPIPSQTGNSILYGHNFPALLGGLPRVKPGEKITIVFSDKSYKTFTIGYTAVVSPDQIHILDASKDKRITIYTCTGLFDEKRFVAVAFL